MPNNKLKLFKMCSFAYRIREMKILPNYFERQTLFFAQIMKTKLPQVEFFKEKKNI